MKNLITSGELQRMFLAEDANTIIRRPNCRKFCLDNDIFSINYDELKKVILRHLKAVIKERKENTTEYRQKVWWGFSIRPF